VVSTGSRRRCRRARSAEGVLANDVLGGLPPISPVVALGCLETSAAGTGS
jgi:hypothetical protein